IGSSNSVLDYSAVNIASKGDVLFVLVSCLSGDRFTKICESYEMKTNRIEVDWGENIVIDDVAYFLEKNKNIKAVFMTQCETSTGILNPVEELSKTIQEKSDALIIVDGVSCVGGVEAEMDAWGVDVFVTGSQKAMMLPA